MSAALCVVRTTVKCRRSNVKTFGQRNQSLSDILCKVDFPREYEYEYEYMLADVKSVWEIYFEVVESLVPAL